MSEYITLLGADDVRAAGYAMKEAAHQMSAAASQFNDDVNRLQRILDEHVEGIQAALAAAKEADHA